MKEKTQIKISVIILLLLVTFSIIFYISLRYPIEHRPVPLTGHLEESEIDVFNNSITFVIHINNTRNIELKEDGEYNFDLHIYNYSENNDWSQWGSDEYSFEYIDKNNDGLLNTGDQLIINSSERALEKLYEIEVELSVCHNQIAGHIITDVKIDEKK